MNKQETSRYAQASVPNQVAAFFVAKLPACYNSIMDPHTDPEAFFTLPPQKVTQEWALAGALPDLAHDCPHSVQTVLEMWSSGAHVAVPLKVSLMEACGGFVFLADALPLLVSRPEARAFQKVEMYRAIIFDVLRRSRGRVRDDDATRLDPFVEPCGSALTEHVTSSCQRIIETICPDWASGNARAAWTTPRGSEQNFMGGTEWVALELTGNRLANWDNSTLADRSAMVASIAAGSVRRKAQVQALFEVLGPTAVVERLQVPGWKLVESYELLWKRFVARRESHLISLGLQARASSMDQLRIARL